MSLPLRKILTTVVNDGTINPRSDDGGNWNGCGVGNGQLIGTYRDISACAMSDYLKRPATVQDLRNLTEAGARRIIKSWWDKMRMSEVTNQDIANIVFHLKMHFGNVHIAQIALRQLGENVDIDGQFGPQTLEALKRQTRRNAFKTYTAIRNLLKQNYQQSNPVNRAGFMRFLTEDFPEKPVSKQRYWLKAAIIIIVIALLWYGYKYFKTQQALWNP